MSDDDKLDLRSVPFKEIEETLSFALRYAGRKRVHHADDVMARITAERLVQHLERSGYVLMKKPDRAAASTSGHSHCQSALKSFQGTASNRLQLASSVSASCF